MRDTVPEKAFGSLNRFENLPAIVLTPRHLASSRKSRAGVTFSWPEFASRMGASHMYHLGSRVNSFQWQRRYSVFLHSCVHACTNTHAAAIGACSFACPLSRFFPCPDTDVYGEKGIVWFRRRARGFPLTAGGSYPTGERAGEVGTRRISGLWGSAVSIMVVDLRFIPRASRHFCSAVRFFADRALAGCSLLLC